MAGMGGLYGNKGGVAFRLSLRVPPRAPPRPSTAGRALSSEELGTDATGPAAGAAVLKADVALQGL